MILTVLSHSLYRLFLFLLQLHHYVCHPSLACLDLFYFIEDFFSALFLRLFSLFKDRVNHEEDTYGSFSTQALMLLIKDLNIEAGTRVYDLGSGKGKSCLIFSMIAGCDCIGIEKNRYYNRIHRLLRGVFFQQKRIQILEADFLTQPLPDCDLLFIPATCLSDTSIERITHSINISKHKPILISSSLNIKANDYSLYKEVKLAMSWGFCRVYISRPI